MKKMYVLVWCLFVHVSHVYAVLEVEGEQRAMGPVDASNGLVGLVIFTCLSVVTLATVLFLVSRKKQRNK